MQDSPKNGLNWTLFFCSFLLLILPVWYVFHNITWTNLPVDASKEGAGVDIRLKEQGISLSLEIIKDELSSVHLGLWVSRSGKLFKIISDRSKLQAKMFSILSLQNVASMLGVHLDSS